MISVDRIESAVRALMAESADEDNDFARERISCYENVLEILKGEVAQQEQAVLKGSEPASPPPVCPKCGGSGRMWDNGDKIECDCVPVPPETTAEQLLLHKLDVTCSEHPRGAPCFQCGESSILHTFKRILTRERRYRQNLEVATVVLTAVCRRWPERPISVTRAIETSEHVLTHGMPQGHTDGSAQPEDARAVAVGNDARSAARDTGREAGGNENRRARPADNPAQAPLGKCTECGCTTGGGDYCFAHAPYTVWPLKDGSWRTVGSNGTRRVWLEEPSPLAVAVAREVLVSLLNEHVNSGADLKYLIEGRLVSDRLNVSPDTHTKKAL